MRAVSPNQIIQERAERSCFLLPNSWLNHSQDRPHWQDNLAKMTGRSCIDGTALDRESQKDWRQGIAGCCALCSFWALPQLPTSRPFLIVCIYRTLPENRCDMATNWIEMMKPAAVGSLSVPRINSNDKKNTEMSVACCNKCWWRGTHWCHKHLDPSIVFEHQWDVISFHHDIGPSNGLTPWYFHSAATSFHPKVRQELSPKVKGPMISERHLQLPEWLGGLETLRVVYCDRAATCRPFGFGFMGPVCSTVSTAKLQDLASSALSALKLNNLNVEYFEELFSYSDGTWWNWEWLDIEQCTETSSTS